MKLIGLIGGMSWESTALYYRIINQQVKQQLGGLHSARCVIYSVDFYQIETLQSSGEWEKAGKILADAARSLEAAGADFIVLCTNTMHKVAQAITNAVAIPLLHIADATAAQISHEKFKRVGLLATAFTMEQPFYIERFERSGIEIIVPDTANRKTIHDIIYQELCLGVIRDESRRRYCEIMAALVHQGAEAIILGCTEITLLVGAQDACVPLFDTTQIHAEEAVRFALCGSSR
ncbi:aspartate/glutamate racemase family protein [Pantoea sp. Mb-10]|uniref:aspartate/glutamate racemase family protein n=1 Tax=unclassified Pantoea TaxID=2630326 RepID=UPI001E38E6DF|nr:MULTISPECIES: aspartate/glutamate racemase family protein [unclassified Pantoea]MCE0491074.1 aspartate/glutamate racemase family protein [Pantoea sp. Mb-10]MCE0502563.1 aspartate/glutamate racemase family protein [Pantoea sp. Pb-8]